MPWADARLGADRLPGAYAWRSLLRTGTVIAGGSDFPVELPNPFHGIHAAATRRPLAGPDPSWQPEQRMTRGEAVRAFTAWNAYAAHRESELGSLDLRNRIMMTVHGPRLSADRYLRYLDERSRDAALVGVHAIGGVFNFPFEPGRFVASYADDLDALSPHPLTAEGRTYYDRDIPMMAQQAEIVHRNGAKVVGQIFHGGVVVGPSPIDDELARGIPHPLTANESADFVAACALAAGRAVAAGFDGIEVHAAHGYLVNQFLSPATNRRDDEFGGSLEHRLRFLLAILDAVRRECGIGFPIGVRLPGAEFIEGGLDVAAVCSIARHLERWGIAYVNVSTGNYTGLSHGVHLAYVASSYTPQGPNVPFAAAIRNAVDRVPVIVAGRFTDLRFADYFNFHPNGSTAENAQKGTVHYDPLIGITMVGR
jgi:2,4-dienoyl-CoA reductase (NADPH2)